MDGLTFLAMHHLIGSLMVIILFLFYVGCSSVQCPRQPGARCKGPYVIRTSAEKESSVSGRPAVDHDVMHEEVPG